MEELADRGKNRAVDQALKFSNIQESVKRKMSQEKDRGESPDGGEN